MIALLALILTLSPWKGPEPAASVPGAVHYVLNVRGAAHEQVDLRASGLPSGWIASFCTNDLCSPMRYSMQLDGKGAGSIEFQAIRIDESAAKHVSVTVSAAHARPVTVRVWSR